MAGANDCGDMYASVVSRRLVKASDASIKPLVLPVSSLDLLMQGIQVSMFCIYPRPTAGGFDDVVAAFETGLPTFLNHFFPFAGRIATNPRSGVPEIHCSNQGAELVVAKVGVLLASLDFGTMSASVRKTQLPYAQDVTLSVQVVSFTCGGFTVSWCTSHLLVDGSALSLLVGVWSELARSGTLAAESRPNHDRSVLRPRAPPSYGAWLDAAFTPLHGERQVNVLTTEQSFVERLYYIEAPDIERLRRAASRDGDGQRATRVQAVSAYLWKALAGVVGAADAHCRMGWWVDGRRRITAAPQGQRAAMRNYVGNVVEFSVREASVQEVVRMPLLEVAAMVREATTTSAAAAAASERLQELVDWAEEHKTQRHVETATIGLGSPTLCVTAFASFPLDTDFGFGRAAMAMPTSEPGARQCSGYVQIVVRPGDDGSWIASAFVWPRLAAALETDEPRVFRPVTAEYLGLCSSQVQRCRL